MKAQYENKVISSVLLWLDNAVCTKGEAFTDHGSSFYDVGSQWYGYYSYGAPYKQFVPDFSIPDSAPTSPQIPTGVHVSGVFRPKGVSGLVDIDYGNGHVYFDHEIAEGQISGDYAVKDFNIYLTNKMEQDLLFETKVNVRPRTTTNPSALESNTITYPAIFVKNAGGRNEAFTLGGEDLTVSSIRTIVLADSQFNLDAVCSIIRDKVRTNIPLIESNQYPFNTLGGYKDNLWLYEGGTSVYNYTGLISEISNSVYVKDVFVSQFSDNYIAEIKNVNPNVYSAIIDLELEKPRYPRL